MKLLLDTHVVMWTLLGPERLATQAREAIEDHGNEVFVSVVTPWELSIKASRQRLGTSEELEAVMDVQDFELLPVHWRHTRAIRTMSLQHGDPFDRMLVAQAQVDGMTIVTADRKLRDYEVSTMPAA